MTRSSDLEREHRALRERLSRLTEANLRINESRDSGDRQPQLRITKEGDVALRRVLNQAAHYILGPFGPDSDLRRWGLRYAESGAGNAKKRAVVAVARRLAVLLLALWKNGEVYDPLRQARAAEAA